MARFKLRLRLRSLASFENLVVEAHMGAAEERPQSALCIENSVCEQSMQTACRFFVVQLCRTASHIAKTPTLQVVVSFGLEP
jgi:hypothetical protein